MKLIKLLFFNSFTKQFVSQIVAFAPSRRIRSMITDFSYVLTAFFPIFVIFLIPYIFYSINSLIDPIQSIWISLSISLIPYSVMLFIIINKDFYGARSIAKRELGYQIINTKTGEIATQMQCLLRNTTVIIWPLEVIFVLLTPNRRLGDRIAGTKLIDVEKVDPKSILIDIEHFKKTADLQKVLVVSIILTLIFDTIGLLPAIFVLFT